MKSVLIRSAMLALSAAVLLASSGCTSRGMTITSEPPGAEVSINRRVVGTTPIRVAYTHYGTYRIELRKFGYDVMVREEPVNPPIYGYDPPAVVADNIAPARLDDEIYLHYVLKPHGAKAAEERAEATSADQSEDKTPEESLVEKAATNKAALLDRATKARGGTITHPKTGEEIHVAIGAELNKAPKVAAQTDEPVMYAEGYATVGPVLTPNLELPAVLAPLRRIEAPQPEGATLAKQYGIETEGANAFVKPDEAKKTAAPTTIRTPKEEELIYDQPKMTDPSQKKK